MKLTKENIRHIYVLRENNYSVPTIAEVFKVSPETIYYWLKREKKSGEKVIRP